MIIRDNFCFFCIIAYVVTPSSKLSPRDGSDEGSQLMVSMRNKKNYPLAINKYPLLSRALSYYTCYQGHSRYGDSLQFQA